MRETHVARVSNKKPFASSRNAYSEGYPLPGRFVAKSLGTPRTIQPPLLFL